MLDKRFIRDHPDEVKAAVRVKGINLDVDELLDLDTESRRLQTEVDRAQALRKSSSKEYARADEARRAELKVEHEVRGHARRERRYRAADHGADQRAGQDVIGEQHV